MDLALDTNAYRALHDGDRALTAAVRGAARIGLPVIVIGELRFGFLHGTRLAENTTTLERFLASPRVSVLGLDDETTHQFAEIAALLRRQGTPIQQNDIWIAALCKQHRFMLATRDRGYRNVLGLHLVAF